MAQASGQFSGNQRFTLRRRLGAGGMGEVYEAYDRESQQTVALKTLLRAEPTAIYRFKREFRALAEVIHPNLVSLYELVAEGESWFFTMELVDGVDFLKHVRGGDPASVESATLDTSGPTPQPFVSEQTMSLTAALPDDERDTSSGLPAAGIAPLRLDRLRAALRQLADGVHVLHEVGRVHRDLKPSNVLVTAEGRVVILDFGLVTERLPERRTPSVIVAGTPAYMSPEQAVGEAVTEATDWYSVGVILYEALTGQLPFTGRSRQVLNDKLRFEPPPPSALAPEVPEDLDALCRDLLHRDPALRPSGEMVLERLGRTPAEVAAAAPLSATVADRALVGRDHHLAALRDAFRACREARRISACVHGTSGIGKTTLVRHFLERLRQREKVVILGGRCFERESVPYKALDGVVDSLSRYLMSLPKATADTLMPRDVFTLSRLFPVLLRVDAVINAPHRGFTIPDPHELRLRAFSALAELLARIADRLPLVIHIDDLQWADADSLAFLDDLLRSPDPASMLLITSFRREEIDSKPFLVALLASSGGDNRRALSVDPLTRDEARDLTMSLLEPDAAHDRHFVDRVVGEAAGSPFLVEQLARYALASQGAATTGVTLAQMLEARMRLLPPGARPLLETLAVAGRPVEPKFVQGVAGLEGDERPLLGSLRAAQLVRTSGSAQHVELYHDRIREILIALMEPAAVREIHRRLAETFEARGVEDPEALFEHWLGAGERKRASGYAAQAAERASAALAFDRAALLYRKALELSPPEGSDVVEIKKHLGEALANAGRSAEAARAYLDAAEKASTGQALEFRRRAAEQLLISGHIDEGLAAIRAVLAPFGMRLPSTPRRALLSMLLHRLWLKLRGLEFVERDSQVVAEQDLLRIDICWAVSAGLALVDIIRAADFQTRHLLLALRAGEPYRVARALAVEAGFSATAGDRGRDRFTLFSAKAEALARKVDVPHAIGLSALTAGVAAFCVGEWRRGAELSERAEAILREQCTGVPWELTNARSFLLSCLMFLGRMREVSRRLPALLSAAHERGNLYAATEFRTRTNLVWIAADDPERARREVMEAMQQWSHRGFHRQHYNSLLALSEISLYTGDGPAAWQLITGEWGGLARSLLLRIQQLRVEAMHLRARCALAAGAAAGDREPWLRIAERLARRIAQERMPWSDPLALLIRAAVASARGDDPAAAGLLSLAVEGFTRAEMGLYAAAARRRLGVVVGGEGGGQLVAEADAWMTDQSIRRPEAMTRMLVPGFRGDGPTSAYR